VTGTDFGTTARVLLTVSPGVVGSNEFRVLVTDFDTGALVRVTSVGLRFSLPARPDIGSSTLDLRGQGDGIFSSAGSNLSMSGEWRVAALVTEATTSAEIDLNISVK
jgi:hypothetical protein